MFRRVCVLGFAVLVGGCGASQPAGPRQDAQVFSVLHAVRGSNPGIYDEQGRQVLLRGVNYNSIGDYYQDNPAYPPTIPPQASDFPRMASLGLNVVRLLVHWSKLEPQPGIYDENYIALIRGQIEQAAAQGLYVVVDMHQDAWGKYVATREAGDSCIPPLEAAIGWDGAPQWATLTDGLTTCRLAQRELSPAVQTAFTNFYLDAQGIQTHFVATWQHLVQAVAPYRNVAGYDLLNEPNPGLLVGANNITTLSALYTRLVGAIRDAESALPGQPRHIVLFEPDAEWSTLGITLPTLPTFTADTNLVFAPHLYCGAGNITPTANCFQFAQGIAALYATTFWIGEWGYYGAPDTIGADVYAFAAQEDQALVGSAMWQWRQACGDPHTIGTPGGKPAAQVTQLVLNGCPGDVDLGYVQANMRAVSRTYPRAAPGRLTQLSADPDTGAASLGGEGSGTLELWVPARIGTPLLSGSGIGAPRVEAVSGGYRVQVPVNGAWTLQVKAS